MSLDALRGVVTDGMTTLDPSDFGSVPLAAALTDFLGGALALAPGATVDDQGDRIVLRARPDGLPWPGIGADAIGTLTVTFTSDDEDNDRATVRFEFIDGPLASTLLSADFPWIGSALPGDTATRIEFPLTSIAFETETTTLAVEAAPQPPLDLTATSLARYLGGASIANWLPGDTFPFAQSGLSLERFAIVGQTDLLVVTHFDVTVSPANDPRWVLVDDLLEVRDLSGQVVVGGVMADPEASMVIGATAELGGIPLRTSVALPHLDLQAWLEPPDPDDRPDLTAALARLFDLPVPMAEVYADELNVLAEPTDHRYEIAGAISGDWVVVSEPRLALDRLSFAAVLVTEPAWTVWGGLGASLTIGASEFDISAEYAEGSEGWRFEGALADGSDIPLRGLIEDMAAAFSLSGGVAAAVADTLGEPTITDLGLSLDTATNDLSVAGVVALADSDKPEGQKPTLAIDLGLANTAEGYQLGVVGALTIGQLEFEAGMEVVTSGTGPGRTTEATLYGRFVSSEDDGTELNLVEDLLDPLTSNAGLDLPDDGWNVTSLWVKELYLAKTTDAYRFAGELSWRPTMALGDEPIGEITAVVDLERGLGSEATTTGTIEAEIEAAISGFELPTLAVGYDLGAGAATLRLTIGGIGFTFAYQPPDDANAHRLSFGFDAEAVEPGQPDPSLTIGDVLTYLVSLVDPSIDRFDFGPPWNFITDFDLVDLLRRITVHVDIYPTTARTGPPRNDPDGPPPADPGTVAISVTIDGMSDLVPDVLAPLVTVDSITLQFEAGPRQANGKRTTSTSITLTGSFPPNPDGTGNATERSWNPLDEAPPPVPGHGEAMFDLRYLGIGQHVGFQGDNEFESMAAVMSALDGSVEAQVEAFRADRSIGRGDPNANLGALEFRADSEWLIGFDLVLLRAISVQGIFNDPEIYGLRLEVAGGAAKAFEGLEFEILYQRITDNLGKYHTELVLPDHLRHFPAGAASVTLGVIVVDIYTNGDFKLDFGFPWDLDFSRSCALEVFPFVGAGGFYLNKLSALTAGDAAVPRIDPTKGSFSPIYEFGLGLRIGLGKSFRAGPLKAEVSITVQGIIEGTLSWYNRVPAIGGGAPDQVSAANEPELFYRIRGGVAIVGRIYGEVDFVIIQVRVEVVAEAVILFLLERYKPIEIALRARVEVSASIKVAFITIDFGFEMNVSHEFTIDAPEGTDAPWLTP